MGKGGILQLVSYGCQDKILVDNPQISFFKKVYKKPTLFSIEQIERPIISGEANIKNIVMPNYGDLLKTLDLKFDLPSIKFAYKDDFYNIIYNHLNDNNYGGNFEAFNYNIDKLEILELILYNYIIYIVRLPTTSSIVKNNIMSEINDIHKTLNGTIVLQSDKFNLIYNEIDLQDFLLNNSDNLATDLFASPFINDNTVLNNVVNQVNSSSLLSTEQLNSLNANLDVSEIISLNGSNIINYSFQFIKNIKLQMIDIMMQNYDTYISLFNINTYYDNYLKNETDNQQVLLFNDFYSNFLKNLSYSIIKSGEIYSYNKIANTAPSDILTLNLNSNNIYLINTPAIYYSYPLIIIVDSTNISSIQSLNILSILQVIKNTIQTDNTSMFLYSMIFNHQYDLIDNTCFITCSDTVDSLINYSYYHQIYNVSSINSPLNISLNNNIYIFQIKGDYTNKFIQYKLSYIFDSKLSTSPYDYFYNTFNDEKFYVPLAVFLISSSTYNSATNITTITTSKLNLTNTFTVNDLIFIKNNVGSKIDNINVSSMNTDVNTNYNSYITNSNIESNTYGLSNNNILTNIVNISIGPIKYNVDYLINLYNNIFNIFNYFFHIIEVGYNPALNSFTTYSQYQNSYLPNILDYLLNIITNTNIEGYFLYRDPNDVLYNGYYNLIKTSLYKLSQDYKSLIYNYNFNLNNYSNALKQKLFSLITTYTVDSTLTNNAPSYPIELSNIYLNKSIGLGNEFCIIRSNKQLNQSDLLDIKTNKFTLNTYINDNNTSQTINYIKLDCINNIVFTNITFFVARNNTIIIVDNYDTIYIVNNLNYRSLLSKKKFKDLQLLEDFVPWSPIVKSVQCSFNNIISNNLFHKKYFIDKKTDTLNNLYYNTDLNNIIQIIQNSSFKPFNITTIENKWLTNYAGKIINDNKLYYVNGLCTVNELNNNITYLHNSFVPINNVGDSDISTTSSSINKKINYSTVYNIMFYNGYIITIDISNYIIHIFNETTYQTDIIDISFLLYQNNNITNFIQNSFQLLSANIQNDLLYLYLLNNETSIYTFLIFNITITNNLIDLMIDTNLEFYNNITVDKDITYFDLPKKIEFVNSEYILYIYNSRTVYNNFKRTFPESIKMVIWNNQFIVFYLNNINTLMIYNITDFFSSNTNIPVLSIDSTFNNWLLNGITYMWIDNDNNLYSGTNNTINKVNISNVPLSEYQYYNTITIDKIYGNITNGSYADDNNSIYILTTKYLLKYGYSSYSITDYNVLPSDYYYSYKNAEIIFNNYYNTFTIIDKIKNRCIYGNYSLKYDQLIFNNINSFNIVLFGTSSIFYIQNKLNGDNYSQTMLLLINNYFYRIKLVPMNGSYYYNSFDSFASPSNNIIDIIYNKDTLTYLTNAVSTLYLNTINMDLDDIIDISNIYQYVINNVSYNSSNKYNITNDDNYYYLVLKTTNLCQILRLDTSTYSFYPYIGNDSFFELYTLPVDCSTVYLDDIKSVEILKYDDLLIHNSNDLYYVNNNNIIKLDIDFGYSGYIPTNDIGPSGPAAAMPINQQNNSPGYSLWYVPQSFVFYRSYDVISQTNFYNNLYFLTVTRDGATGATGPSGYVVNYIDTITNISNQSNIDLLGITGPISMYSLRSINLNDWLVFSNNNNVYLYQFNGTNTYIYKSTISCNTNVKSVSFNKISYITDPYNLTQQFDTTYNYVMYILTTNNTTYDGNDVIKAYFLHNNGIATVLNNSYIKPYHVCNNINNNTYFKSPDINHPNLFYIDLIEIGATNTAPSYQEYLIGQEQSQINILNLTRIDFAPIGSPYIYGSTGITGPNDLFLYEMQYEYNGDTGLPFPKYINSLINKPKSNNNPSLYFSFDNDPNYDIIILFKYKIRNARSDNNLPNSGPILYTYNIQRKWINNFNLDIGYYDSFTTKLEVYEISYTNHIIDNDPTFYRVEGYYYFSEHPKNRYTLEQHDLYYTTLYQSNGYNYIYNTNNITGKKTIQYITQFTYNQYDSYPSYNNILINIDNTDYLNPELYSQLQNNVNNINCKIDIDQLIGPINIITRFKQYNFIFNDTNLNKNLTNNYFMDGFYNITYATKIFYNIDPINDMQLSPYSYNNYNWNLSDFLYVKFNNNYYVGKYGDLISQPITISTDFTGTYLILFNKVQSHMNWLDETYISQGFLIFQDLYIIDAIPYNSLTKLQEYSGTTGSFQPSETANFYNANIITLDYINWIASTMTNNNSSNLSYSFYRNDLYTIVNNILVNTSNLISYNDNVIVSTDVNGIIYNNIQQNNVSSSLYLKISSNFDNYIGYKAINNKISTSLKEHYLNDFKNAMYILFQNYDDYIVNQLQYITTRPSTSDFLNWTELRSMNIESIIELLYTYLKFLCNLSPFADKYVLFISQTVNDSVNFLYDNVINFRDIYIEMTNFYYFSNWDNILQCITTLYYGISYINNVLNNNFVIENGIASVLICKKNIQINSSNSVIYLEDQIDSTVLAYIDDVLLYLFNNYYFNDILILKQNIYDLYFNNLNTLFNNNEIGLTTFTNINDISLNYNLNINNIILNKNTIPDNSYNPFILPFSYDIYNIDHINDFLNSNKTLYNSQIEYYQNNNNILNLSKLSYESINNSYIQYIEEKKQNPILCYGITGPNSLLVYALYDIKINDLIGFYSTDNAFHIYKVIGINYGTNAINYPVIPSQYNPLPDYIPVTITIDAPSMPPVTYNFQIYYGIDLLRLNNYTPSLNSSINIRNAISYIIFNNFSLIDNIFYDDYRPDRWGNGQYNYWYYYDENYDIKYFTTYPNKQAYQGSFTNYQVDYSKYIISLIKSTYKISDLSILQKAFNKTFQINDELYTNDSIIYKFSQLCSSSNLNNKDYYSYLFFIHSIYHFIDNYKYNSKYFIDINNIQILINKFNTPNLDDINSMLKLISQTVNSNLYKYNVYAINIYNLDDFSQLSNNMVLSNDLIHSFISPFNNFNTHNNFNLDYALKNKCITTHIKFTDINKTINNIIKYYSNSSHIEQTLVDIMFYDRFTKDIAINKMKSIVLLNNSDKFDFYNGISLNEPYISTSIIVESTEYDFNNNVVYNDNNLYYNNVTIDSCERINYIRLKIQQLLIWYLATIIEPNNPIQLNYYKKLPENMMYNYDTDNISSLNTNQFTIVSNFVLYLCNTYQSNLRPIIDSINVDYYENSNITNILEIISHMETIKDLNTISNMYSPCNYYYIAYLMLKFINLKDINTSNTFIYTNENLKCNYNDDSIKIKNYTKSQTQFLITEYYKNTFILEDWIGQVDGINKIFLVNHSLLKNYINNINNRTLNNQNFTACLSSASSINSDIYMINYILMIIFNSNGNSIESHYILNSNIVAKYPTLYLINGSLVRTTNLPDYYYYDVSNMNNSNYLMIKQIDLINNDHNVYNIVNNMIGKTLNYIKTEITEYYNSLSISGTDFVGLNKYYINIENDIPSLYFDYNSSFNNYMKFNYGGSYQDNYFQTSTVINHPIINNTYGYFIDADFKIYYCFITHISNNDIFINTDLSDDLTSIVEPITIYGGLYNIIDKIYVNRSNQYIAPSNILDRYNEYDELSNKIINYMGSYFGTNYKEYNKLMTDDLFPNLINNIVFDHKNIKIDGNTELSNYLLPNDLFAIQSPFNFNINESLTLYSKIISMLEQKKTEYNNILVENNKGFTNKPSINYVINATSFPYNIYNPQQPKGSWIKYLGHYILDYIELYIGDESIQKITDDYLHINYGLNIYYQKMQKYLYNIGYTPEMVTPSLQIDGKTIYILIPWFFNNSTNNLPLISLINTKVHFKFKTKQLDDLTVHDDFVKVVVLDNNNKTSDKFNIKGSMLMDYIFLDVDERNKFVSYRHEYLIEQIQYLNPCYINKNDILNASNGTSLDGSINNNVSDTIKINLNFKNCVKDIYWFCQIQSNLDVNDYSNYTSSPSYYNFIRENRSSNGKMFSINGFENIALYKNNPSISDIITSAYNRIVEFSGIDIDINNINRSWFLDYEIDCINNILNNIPEYDTNTPITNNQIVLNGKNLLNQDSIYTTLVLPYQKYENNPYNGLNVYSFSLNPSDLQPSGSLNFSMMKANNVNLNMTLDSSLGLNNDMMVIKVIARNYNILRIFSGLGACVYNN